MSDILRGVSSEVTGRNSNSRNTAIVRNSFKKVTLENAVDTVPWRHQLATLLKDANGDIIAGDVSKLDDLKVPDSVELLMEEKIPSFSFAYKTASPIEEVLNALIPKGSKASTIVDVATIAADLTSSFINGMNKDENEVSSVFNPWTKSIPAWNQELSKLRFSYTFNFKMGQSGLWNAKQEVFLPIINLIAPVLPRELGTFFTKGPIPGKVDLLSKSILGALSAGFNKEGGDSLAANLISAVKKYTYNITFGNVARVENCLIDEAKPSFSSDTDEDGYPIAGSVELHFLTIAPYGLVSPEGARAIKFGVNG